MVIHWKTEWDRNEKVSKFGGRSRRRLKGFLFNSYYTDVLGKFLLLPLDSSIIPLICSLYCWVLSKEVLYSHNHEQLYIRICRCMPNHDDDTIKTSGHDSLEKYTLSLYLKGLCMWEGVEDWTKTATYWHPQLFWLSQPFFSVLLGCSTGGQGAQPLLGHGSHNWFELPVVGVIQ